MACQSQNNNCEANQSNQSNQGPRTFNYVTLIVLYILLAIILGAWIW